ncbi:MAG TPA: amino acid adenylation domain-containing protein [Pyrinomonadaceae bacterium]|nr:amino acid adenylation domain-containing protein [Pyrinomonadaceae bacterium]
MLHESTTNLSLSNAKQALLQKYLSGDVEVPAAESWTIARRAPDEPARPSLGQEQLWIHAQLVADPLIYNEPVTVRRTGPLDISALQHSLNEIIRRHEAWRTNFAIQDGQLIQLINPVLELELPFTDLRGLNESEREVEALRLATQDARQPFDLNQGPLLRAMLVQISDNEHRIYMTLHQIIFDGVSLYSVFLPELETLYEAFANGRPAPLPELPIQYADFADWQRQRAQSGELSEGLAYWTRQLAGAPAALELPTDLPRPAIQTFNGEQLSFQLPRRLTDALKALSRREGTTLFMTLLAAFQIVLHRYTDEDDLVIGTVTTSRKRSEFDALLGFFLNTLVLRTDISGNPTFRELLGRVRKVTVDALANDDVPVHQLVKELGHERDPSRNPLFQVMFVLEPPLPEPGPGWDLSQVDVDAGIARVDLYLELDDRTEGLVGRFRYNRDLFARTSINRMLKHFTKMLEAVVASPERAISDYSMHTAVESGPELIRGGSVRPTNYFTPFVKDEIEQSIGDRFESQVRKFPEHVAIKSLNHEWSYAELSRQVDRVAQAILSLRGSADERIAVLLEHDAPMMAALLGTLKAGKTYVPLDPSYPSERLDFILKDSQASALITNNQNLATVRELTSDVQLINIDRLGSAAALMPAPHVSPERLAYILYTSGSTGNPKGVMQNHRNVLHHIRVYTNNLHLNDEDRLTLLSSFCFDASVMDIYGALLNGATLYPVDIKREGVAGLAQRLRDENITIYHSTPTVFRYFVSTLIGETDFPHLRLVVLGGEKVTRTDVESYQRHFSDDCLFVNGLGPTEATVALQNFIDKQTMISGDNVPVGFPVEDTEVLLLNKDGRPAEVSGEIAVKSAHVAVGYWRNPGATARAFTTNGAGPAVRIYRTGDMGRRLPDGSLLFEGRKDFQVKIRGFRVELGEIESTICQHHAIREGVVVMKENAAGDQRLIAYLVPRETRPSPDELRGFLKPKLPDYMIPGSFVVLDSLPLTASGKLNRRALPAPDESADRAVTTFAAPRTPLEKSLTKIWANVLELNAIGINDNFFDLGGHSLLAVRLFGQIEEQLGKRLPLATLFQAPTVAQLAEILKKENTPSWSSLVSIQTQGSRLPFFCVHAVGGNVLEYYDLAQHLGSDQPFYGLQSRGLDGAHAPHTRIEDMAAHYIKEIREVQPVGPYFIGGRSLGGIIAYETACQLRAQGQEVGLLALLDSYPVGHQKLLPQADSFSNRAGRFLKILGAHISNVRNLRWQEKPGYVISKLQYGPVRIKSKVWRTIYQSYQNLGRDLPPALRDVEEFNWLAAWKYRPKVYDGRVTLFWASRDLSAKFDLIEGWQTLARDGMELHEIPGTHLDMIKEPHVGELARMLNDCLLKAQPPNRERTGGGGSERIKPRLDTHSVT